MTTTTSRSPIHDLYCIVVHHNSPQTAIRTVTDVRDSVNDENLVVVDNSNVPDAHRQLRQALPSSVAIHTVQNRGYAHAVNRGLGWLAARHLLNTERASILVLTHEVRIDRSSTAELVDALLTNPQAAAVGPRLHTFNTQGELVVWSHGGLLTSTLLRPRHTNAGASVDNCRTPESPRQVQWVDGAAVLYRAHLLEHHRMLENFFLYYEELELHTRLRQSGFQILVAPAALAEQTSSGTPGLYRGRNGQYFQYLHGNIVSRAFTVPLDILRLATLAILGRGSWQTSRDAATGWFIALRTGIQWTHEARHELASHRGWPYEIT